MQDFRQLRAWKDAHRLVLELYPHTESFPPQEAAGLTRQLRNAVRAIPASLAEGCGRGNDQDFGRSAASAVASARELDYLLLLAKDLGYLPEPAHARLSQRLLYLQRSLVALHKALTSSQRQVITFKELKTSYATHAAGDPVTAEDRHELLRT